MPGAASAARLGAPSDSGALVCGGVLTGAGGWAASGGRYSNGLGSDSGATALCTSGCR
ncbi:hypothetical protein J7E73_03000 [Paenibacillus albidus]|uniref:hypothetical protein n=1 Tax=Paenibacillus albidus TaxID=2041023 RepID=UPI001BEC1E22|nr:hypothetical protein [Paenibacillus albidus]MBT2288112.1 hypothetical protein [Paenibacillus albidus]